MQNNIVKESKRKASNITNKGQIVIDKNENDFRIFSINPNGFGPDKVEKMELLKKKCIEMKIDSVMFSSPDRRQSTITTSNVLKYFKRIDCNTKINTSNSRDSSYMKNTQLPGGTMTVVWGKYSNFIDRDSFYNDNLGKQTSY